MTIAEVDVKLQLALPQGWTKEQIFERLGDILASLEDENAVVEFGYEVTKVNSDPFNEQTGAIAKLPKTLSELAQQNPNNFPGTLVPFYNGLQSNTWKK